MVIKIQIDPSQVLSYENGVLYVRADYNALGGSVNESKVGNYWVMPGATLEDAKNNEAKTGGLLYTNDKAGTLKTEQWR